MAVAVLLAALAAPAAKPGGGEPAGDFAARLVEAAMERLDHQITYDGSYREIEYPGGDVPGDIGVCTDLVIRAYRAVGVDLQQAVHEDMTSEFEAYPDLWGHRRPDPSIDHRRVPNLQAFFRRHGESLEPSADPEDYAPGDLVTWRLPGGRPHIGILASRRSADRERPLVIHNIGEGPALEDILFAFPITGHFRYGGAAERSGPAPRKPEAAGPAGGDVDPDPDGVR